VRRWSSWPAPSSPASLPWRSDMRRPVVAANWKMHGSCATVQEFLEALLERVPQNAEAPEVVLCPPYTMIAAAAVVATASPVALGGQSCHWEEKGAFTGEVAPGMLVEVGASWVIVGHSERRQHFGESDDTALRRAKAAQQAGLRVIYCLGETLEQRDGGETFAVLERQSSVIGALEPAGVVVAYEPVWAIGTGRNASPEQAQEAHAFLRGRLRALWGPAAEGVRLLYGGSVKPDNAQALMRQPDVDGALVGGASLDAVSFLAIIQSAATV
jgi:triosephosphate isomerase (TIM)